jgi:multidrug efflux pump subunit AcrA (membrane-fusion protein)
MKKKNMGIIGIVTIIVIVIIASKIGESDVEIVEVTQPVETLTVQNEAYDVTIEYVGIISSRSIKQLSYKTTGKVESVNVTVGSAISKGDSLVQMDKTDLKFSLDAAEAQKNAAYAMYTKTENGAASEDVSAAKSDKVKAEDAYNYAKIQYENGLKLFEAGAISQNERDQLKLNMDVQSQTLNQTTENYNKAVRGADSEDITAAYSDYQQANADYEYKKALYDESNLTSPVDGTVVDILYEVGEIAPAGYPVAIVRSEQSILTLGVTGEDLKRIKIGDLVEGSSDGNAFSGEIARLAEIPDADTHLYEVEAVLDTKALLIGQIATCNIIIDHSKGIKIPISSILNDGTDYVYINTSGTAARTPIKILKITGNDVYVEGLKNGDALVVKNINQLYDGQKIAVKQEVNE